MEEKTDERIKRRKKELGGKVSEGSPEKMFLTLQRYRRLQKMKFTRGSKVLFVSNMKFKQYLQTYS